MGLGVTGLFKTAAKAIATRTIIIRFVQKELEMPEKKEVKSFRDSPSTPRTAKIEITKAINTTAPKNITRGLERLNCLLSLPEAINPNKRKIIKRIIKLIDKNKIKFPKRTLVEEATPIKNKAIIKETKALICFLSSPKTFIFSNIANPIKKINKKGYKKLIRIFD